ncbi:MAG: hypothetical protein KDC44_01820 [Phaeodactylibacter sp.]|nr:hypothetical protein [Phaeodactylibacter sp.]
MKTRWETLAANHCTDAALIDTYWQEIERQYTQTARHYHNLGHLDFMFQKFDGIQSQVADPDVFQFSIFYHDIIYNARRQDNELKSAELAQERISVLGLSADRVQQCYEQILATKAHQTSSDTDTNFLLDIDLAILGADLPSYQQYAQQIRAEYAMYPNFLYRKGRRKVLQHFLAMPQIYKTGYFQERLERQARENLEWELSA